MGDMSMYLWPEHPRNHLPLEVLCPDLGKNHCCVFSKLHNHRLFSMVNTTKSKILEV